MSRFGFLRYLRRERERERDFDLGQDLVNPPGRGRERHWQL